MVDNTQDFTTELSDIDAAVVGTDEDIVGDPEQVKAELAEQSAELDMIQQELDTTPLRRTDDEIEELRRQRDIREVDVDGNEVHDLSPKYSPLYNIEEQRFLDNISADYIDPQYIEEAIPDATKDEWLLPHVINSYNAVYRGTKAFVGEIATQNWNKDINFDSYKAVAEQEKNRNTKYDIDETTYLLKARNYENFLYRQTQIDSLRESQTVMANRSTTANLTAGLLGTFVDVDMLLPMSKLAKLAQTSKRVTKLERTLESAQAGATTGLVSNLAASTVLTQSNPYYGEDDVIADAAMGIMLGGTLGALSGGLHGTDTVSIVKYKDDGTLEFTTDVDKIVDDVKEVYTRFEGQVDHSNLSDMPTTGADKLARGRSVQRQLEPDTGSTFTSKDRTGRVTPEDAAKAPEEAKTTLAEDVAARKKEELGEVEGQLNNYSTAYKEGLKLDTDDFRMFVNVRGTASKAQLGDIPRRRDILDDTARGEIETPDTAPVKAAPTVKASPELVETINKRLSKLYDTKKIDTNKVVSMNFKEGRVTSLTTKNKFGVEITMKGDEAEVTAGIIRDMMYIDTSSSMVKVPGEKRIVFENDVQNINKYVIDLGTDATRLLKQEHSFVARGIINKLADTVTGDNTLQGQSAASLKLGYETEYAVGLTFYKDNIHSRAMNIESDKTFTKVFTKFNEYFADTSSHARAQKEVAELISDIDLGKGATMQELRADFDSLLEQYSKRLGSLSSDKGFKSAMEGLAVKYNIPEETLNAAFGITMMGRSVLDSWKNPVKDSPDVLPVLGTEALEPGYYQPQMANPEVINELIRNGADRDSVTAALSEAYYEGLRYKNPGMDDAQMRSEADLVGKAMFGRSVAAPSFTAVEFAAKDTTAFIENYMKLNPNISDTTKDFVVDVLDTLQNEKKTPSVLKDKVPFDRTLEVTIKNKDGSVQTMKAGDMLKTPGLNNWILYGNRAAGIASMASKGINSEAQLNVLRKAMKKELDGSGVDARESAKIELLVESLIAEIKSEPSPLAVRHTSDMVKIVNSGKALFASSKLNMLGFAQIGEYGLIANGVSLSANMNNMGIKAKFSKENKATLKRTQSYLNEMGANSETITLMRAPVMTNIEETGIGSFNRYFDKFVEVSHNVQRKLFGHQFIVNHQRNYSWLNTMTGVINTLEKNNWQATKKLRNKGVTPELINVIKREYEAGRWYFDDGAIRLNYNGADLSDFISSHDRIRITAMLRGIEESTQILRPLPGQSFMATKDPMVGLMMHLQSYAMSSVNNVLLRNAKYADSSTISLLFSTAMASLMATYLKAYVENKHESIEVQHAIFKYNSLLSVPGMGLNYLSETVGNEAFRTSPNYDNSGGYNIPLLSHVNDMAKLPGTLYNILTLQGLSSQDARTLKATIPLLNNPFFARTINDYIDERKVSEANARKEQKKLERMRARLDDTQLSGAEIPQEQEITQEKIDEDLAVLQSLE